MTTRHVTKGGEMAGKGKQKGRRCVRAPQTGNEIESNQKTKSSARVVLGISLASCERLIAGAGPDGISAGFVLSFQKLQRSAQRWDAHTLTAAEERR
ncbi:hypothetical protein MHYP_G00240290 [Metynnis hypsauchen]